jgi:broad specificity phosphatase PhoE
MLQRDEPLSDFALKFNSGRYSKGMTERSHRFLEWIMARPEQHIAVVTHSAFMAAMLREFGATALGCAQPVQVGPARFRSPHHPHACRTLDY